MSAIPAGFTGSLKGTQPLARQSRRHGNCWRGPCNLLEFP